MALNAAWRDVAMPWGPSGAYPNPKEVHRHSGVLSRTHRASQYQVLPVGLHRIRVPPR